ncbi:hypothetical protein HdyHp2_005 [Haloarcula virus Hardyhisp2]|uniref:Uncharacterized protein n=1 Tax=Haloarcula virus Hardyhisp2 TaxID=2811386 RepID=A0A898KC67_9VIRU|nr:hypothetical protein QIT44_gp01 [Haloarcula virus Hardyhisp2]QSJ05021.1 hypothetical protein HdyHp2_005 [Haloarcula virus Hardyhisp2]
MVRQYLAYSIKENKFLVQSDLVEVEMPEASHATYVRKFGNLSNVRLCALVYAMNLSDIEMKAFLSTYDIESEFLSLLEMYNSK